MNKILSSFAVLSLCASCSPGSFTGTVGGNSLAVADVIFSVVNDDDGKTYGALIVMADKPNLCDTLKANREPKQSNYTSFVLLRTSDNKLLAPDVGDYTVIKGLPSGNGNSAYADYKHTDANCTNTLSDDASTGQSGLIKISSFKSGTDGAAVGTFDITYGAGDGVKGSFNAHYCDLSKLPANLNCE